MTAPAHHATLVLPLPSVVQAGYALDVCPADPWTVLDAGLGAVSSALHPSVLSAVRAACHPAGGLHLSREPDRLLVGVLMPLARGVEATQIAAAATLALLTALDLDVAVDLVDGHEVCRDCLVGTTEHPWAGDLDVLQEVDHDDGTELRTTGMRRAGLVQLEADGIPEELVDEARLVVRDVVDALQRLTTLLDPGQALLEVDPVVRVGDAELLLHLEVEAEEWGGPWLRLEPVDGWHATLARVRQA